MIKTVENKIDKLYKCLQTYREIGGNYDELNKRFYRSKVLFDISLSDYIKNLDHSDKKSADTAEMMINIFQNEFCRFRDKAALLVPAFVQIKFVTSRAA